MNIEHGRELLQKLEDMPPENFNYNYVFYMREIPQRVERLQRIGLVCGRKTELIDCETVGCVAGNCVLWFRDRMPDVLDCDFQGDTSFLRLSATFLDLSTEESGFLFLSFCHKAKLPDAIRRLKFLIEGGEICEYPFTLESWCGESTES